MSAGESWFSRILAELDSPLCVADRAGVIRSANAAFERLLGDAARAPTGTALAALLPDADAASLLLQLQQQAIGGPLQTVLGPASRPVRLSILQFAPAPAELALIGARPLAEEARPAPARDALLELTAIFDNAAVGILFTRNRVIERCNQRLAEMVGCASPDELIAKPALILYPDADSYDQVGREAGPLLAAGRAFHTHWLFRRLDGTPMWWSIYGRAVDPNHPERGTVWIVDDITEAKRTEAALQQTLHEVEAIMVNAPFAIVFSRDRRMTRYNAKFREMFRFEGDEGIGRPGRTIYRSDEEYAALGELAAPLLSQGKPVQTELYMQRQDGTEFWASLIGYVHSRQDPRAGTIWIIEDRTEQKIAEEALKRTRDELTAIFDNASVGILFTRDRVFQRCNRRAAEIFGFDAPEDLIGKPGSTIYPDAGSYERVGRAAGPLLGAGQSFHSDWLYRKANGTPVWCTVYARAVDPVHTQLGTIWIVEDITEAKRTEQALQKTVRDMEALMHNAPVGITFTRERRIVRYNPRLGEMFNFDGDEANGMPARVLYRSDEEYQSLGQVAAPLLSQGKPFQMELFLRRKDGSDFWANLIGYVQNLDDPREGTIWIAEDRSAFKRAQEGLQRAHAELVAAKERAEVANRAKSEFLASMSHELRTPLNAVLGYAQILKRDPALSDRQAQGLNTIEQGGHHLLTLINDILDLARIEAGRLDLYPEPLDLGAFLRVVADIIRVKADQKSLLFFFVASETLPPVVSIDEKRLRQVLLNLLGNAIKFTDQGQVGFSVHCFADGPAGSRLRFEVTDSGIGIRTEHMATIFEPFEQVGEAQRRSGGAGLGLAISRALVRLMGGEIQVDSRPGEGSRFWFEIPVPVVQAALDAPAPERTVAGYEGPRKTVLVIDDVLENRAMVIDFLESLNFRMCAAVNGEDGIAQAQAIQPDLILMDNVMPVMSGLEATRRLRALPQFKQVPIIAVSASAFEAHQQQSLAAGASAFLTKPIDFDQLLQKVGALLRLSWIYRDTEPGERA